MAPPMTFLPVFYMQTHDGAGPVRARMPAIFEDRDHVAGGGSKPCGAAAVKQLVLARLGCDRTGGRDRAKVQKVHIREFSRVLGGVRDACIIRHDDFQRRWVFECGDRHQEVAQVRPAIDNCHDNGKRWMICHRKLLQLDKSRLFKADTGKARSGCQAPSGSRSDVMRPCPPTPQA